MDAKKFRKELFYIQNEQQFNRAALELFAYQIENVPAYQQFVCLLKKNFNQADHFSQLPFLPVELFKNHVVTDQPSPPVTYFVTSGTTGMQTGIHYIHDPDLYEETLISGFRQFYGDPEQYCILALLPTYLERKHSSLVFMVEKLIEAGGHPHSGFYLNNYNELYEKIKQLQSTGEKIFLIGVTYALWDLFEQFRLNLTDEIIMETGGMKGKRKEMIREELHMHISNLTGAACIHSEYGMTELLSQAYAPCGGIFSCPPWMRIVIRDLHDPFETLPYGKTGTICIVDLANIHSCGFIATRDLGRMIDDHRFEILGRVDNSDLRGCNLMME